VTVYTGGWPGRIDPKRHGSEIVLALENNAVVNNKTNAKIRFEGTHRALWTFQGLQRDVTGTMTFWHYDTKVMGVDFNADLITDFGYSGHSPTTTLNINAWLRGLKVVGVHGMYSLAKTCSQPFEWTRTVHYKARGAGFRENMWQRFRAGVPWVRKVQGDWWFDGKGWSGDSAKKFEDGVSEALNGPNNEHPGEGHHWFTYDWDENDQWSKRFIDDKAERRYHAWLRRKGMA
jgi:hypothetical protein